MTNRNKTWGFLRETTAEAYKAGVDSTTGLPKTGLEEYLEAIFPETKDWIHNKGIVLSNGKRSRCRPDYQSESLKLIVEFDGLPHYTRPQRIREDEEHTKLYVENGYRVVRIPFFIQLSQKVVKRMFGKNVGELFCDDVPSMSLEWGSTPAILCPAGVCRMAKEFKEYSPEQYDTNIKQLISDNDDLLTGVSFLQKAYEELT